MMSNDARVNCLNSAHSKDAKSQAKIPTSGNRVKPHGGRTPYLSFKTTYDATQAIPRAYGCNQLHSVPLLYSSHGDPCPLCHNRLQGQDLQRQNERQNERPSRTTNGQTPLGFANDGLGHSRFLFRLTTTAFRAKTYVQRHLLIFDRKQSCQP